jgi:hypothetical protein
VLIEKPKEKAYFLKTRPSCPVEEARLCWLSILKFVVAKQVAELLLRPCVMKEG